MKGWLFNFRVNAHLLTRRLIQALDECQFLFKAMEPERPFAQWVTMWVNGFAGFKIDALVHREAFQFRPYKIDGVVMTILAMLVLARVVARRIALT